MRVDAVVFDLDDTLFFEQDVARASLRKVAQAIGVYAADADEVILTTAREIWRAGPYWDLCFELGFASWEGLWADFEGCHPSLEPLRAWVPEYRRQAWSRSLAAFGLGDGGLTEASAQTYKTLQRAGHSLRPGALAVLNSMKPHVRIGLLTNGPPDIQRTKLASYGLCDLFEAVVISGEIGHGMPSSVAFAAVLDSLGASAGRSVMIGDS
jgi:putative hydrolase of the HAD superfamily